MSKLLRANFTRLWKNKVFWGCMIYMFADALQTVLSMYIEHKNNGVTFSENTAFGQTAAAAIVSAVFIGLFIGTEHSSGTLRNKLIIGHSRAAVYFANLAVCVFASLMIHIVYFLTTLIGGIILFDNFIIAPETLWGSLAVSLIIVTAYAAIFLPVSTLITSKATGSATVILMSFMLMITAMAIYQALNEPEFNPAYTITDSTGNEIIEPETKNPYYISGVQRKIYQALYDIVPTCQAARLQLGDIPENPAVIPLWASTVIIVTTSCGALFFRRKDLK